MDKQESRRDAQEELIFLCHSEEDLAEARHLRVILEKEGFRCWMAKDDMPVASRGFPSAIEIAIGTCRQMVVVMSKSAQNSRWVARECLFALDSKNKPLHIVKIDDANLPIYLIERHTIDIRDEHRADGIQHLLRDLKRTARTLNASPLRVSQVASMT